jgi:hypothetical protein
LTLASSAARFIRVLKRIPENAVVTSRRRGKTHPANDLLEPTMTEAVQMEKSRRIEIDA